MQIRNGCDLVSISRIQRLLEKQGQCFLDRVLTALEQADCQFKAERVASRFAAKEACLKALGTGFWQEGFTLLEVEVHKDQRGAPFLRLSGKAREEANRLGVQSMALSLSHEGDFALAMVTIILDENV